MPDTSQISPFTASCGGGLVLNKDVFTMHPGEALQLSNFEPSDSQVSSINQRFLSLQIF